MSHIFLMRHADRDGAPGFDDPINADGRRRASGISWDCDLAIVSPLRRTAQTLEASNIRYRYHLISNLCREYMDGGQHNYLPDEPRVPETSEEFDTRLQTFRELLDRLSEGFGSILVVTHVGFMGHFLRMQTGVGYCEFRRWEPNG